MPAYRYPRVSGPHAAPSRYTVEGQFSTRETSLGGCALAPTGETTLK